MFGKLFLILLKDLEDKLSIEFIIDKIFKLVIIFRKEVIIVLLCFYVGILVWLNWNL